MNGRWMTSSSRRYSVQCRLGVAIGAAIYACGTSLAQSVDETAAKVVLGEIIVTATRRSTSVRDVPYNIQAIPAETLSNIGATRQSDFIRTIPGLSFDDFGPRDGVVLILRGLRTGDQLALSPTTSTYVDDTQVDLFTGLLDLTLLDVDHIEVLRGPQGTLYGGGAIGGTIRYITTKPDLTETEAEVGSSLSATEHGGTNYSAQSMLNAPLVADRIAFRGSIGYFDNDGFIDNPALGANGINFDRTLSGRLALLARLTDDFDAELTYYLQRGEYGDSSSSESDIGKRAASFAHAGSQTTTAQLANLTLSYDFGGAVLTSSTSYSDENEDNRLDGTTLIRDTIFASFVPPNILPELTVVSSFDNHSTTVSEEIRLVSKDTGRWNWVFGGYWFDRNAKSFAQERVPIPFPGQADFEDFIGAAINDELEFAFRTDPSTFRQWAVFGELGLRITPKWQASVGARHFDYRLRETFWAIDQYFGSVDPVTDEFFSGRDEDGLARTTPLSHEFSFGAADDDGDVFRFNTSYDLTDDSLLYVTVAEGYRPGGFNVVSPNTGVTADERQYDPDSIVSYEIGGKFGLAGNRVYVSSALFYIDWSDIQTDIFLPDVGFAILGNAGKARSQGVELEVQARDVAIDGLSLTLGYGYTDVKLTETINELGFDGDRAPRVPRHTGSLIADYAFPASGGCEAGINLLTTYTGSSATQFGAIIPDADGNPVDNPFYLKQDDYWLADLSARLENDTWRLRLFVDNLFDEYPEVNLSLVQLDSPFRSTFLSRTVIRPRTVGIEISRRF